MAKNRLLASELRHAGISVMLEAEEKSMKSQMRSADRLKASKVLILGENELNAGIGVLKNMQDGSQKEIVLADLQKELLQ